MMVVVIIRCWKKMAYGCTLQNKGQVLLLFYFMGSQNYGIHGATKSLSSPISILTAGLCWQVSRIWLHWCFQLLPCYGPVSQIYLARCFPPKKNRISRVIYHIFTQIGRMLILYFVTGTGNFLQHGREQKSPLQRNL